MNLDLGFDGRDVGQALRDGIELVWRGGVSIAVQFRGTDLARIVAVPGRRLGSRACRDVIRGAGTLRRMLRDTDVVVTYQSNPIAVIVSCDEYTRLTGRALDHGEDQE